MIVVGLDPDREPGDVLDRVFPPAECDDAAADRYFACLRPLPAGCSYPTTENEQ